MPASEHVVRFYEADASLVDAVATYCGDAIVAGDVAVVIATAEHRAGIANQLQERGLLDHPVGHDRYLALDAAETLSRFLVAGEVDTARFTEVMGRILSRAMQPGCEVKIFGEMVSLLVADGNPATAIRLEELWNGLQRTHDFTLLCAYLLDDFGGEAHGELFKQVCGAHAQVLPTESYTALQTEADRLRAIAELQQRARSLEVEIVERHQVEGRLEEALAAEQTARLQAEVALRLRDEFLSIAAHELRNPLAALSLHAQVALRHLGHDENLDVARTERSLQAISGQATRLSRLLDRLLDVSRLEASQLTLERRPTDLALLIEHAVARARVWSDRNSITLTSPATLEAVVDPLRLERVLTDLLDNAIKYCPDGEPIEVTLCQPAQGWVELAVADRGIGIPAAERARIFERFFQARSDDARAGLGLGLHISQQIVELHGGQIQVDFPPNGGTRVVISLPVSMEMLADPRVTV